MLPISHCQNVIASPAQNIWFVIILWICLGMIICIPSMFIGILYHHAWNQGSIPIPMEDFLSMMLYFCLPCCIGLPLLVFASDVLVYLYKTRKAAREDNQRRFDKLEADVKAQQACVAYVTQLKQQADFCDTLIAKHVQCSHELLHGYYIVLAFEEMCLFFDLVPRSIRRQMVWRDEMQRNTSVSRERRDIVAWLRYESHVRFENMEVKLKNIRYK